MRMLGGVLAMILGLSAGCSRALEKTNQSFQDAKATAVTIKGAASDINQEADAIVVLADAGRVQAAQPDAQPANLVPIFEEIRAHGAAIRDDADTISRQADAARKALDTGIKQIPKLQNKPNSFSSFVVWGVLIAGAGTAIWFMFSRTTVISVGGALLRWIAKLFSRKS